MTNLQVPTDWRPNRKVGIGAAAIGVPVATILGFALTLFGIPMPPEVLTAIGALISTTAAYLISEKPAGD